MIEIRSFANSNRQPNAEVVVPPCRSTKTPRIVGETFKNRNKAGKFFGRMQHYSRIATQYDKTAVRY